jgi:aldose 1-epimerase
MYRVTKTNLAGIEMIRLEHRATGNFVSVLVGYGGAMNDFVVDGKKILRSSLNASDIERNTKKTFAGSQLFPFVNRVNNARYTINGKEYILPQNDDTGLPHSLHGLIYNKPFVIEAINETEGKLLLSYHFKKDAALYPFEFLLMTEYVLAENSLQVNSFITNLSKEAAPFAYGWHPYLNVSGSVNECKLQLPASTYYMFDERLIPTGQTSEENSFIEPAVIGSKELNCCFKMPEQESANATILEDVDGSSIQLLQTGFGYTQYYIPPDRKSIAVEPQTSIPDALNNGIGLIWMQHDEVRHFSIKLIVENKK